MNRRIADSFVKTFSDDSGLVVPVVPTFGNNDIYPHNVLMPGPNDILRDYTDIWQPFIPEDQRHSFEFGGWFYVEVIPNKLAVFSLNTLYFFDRNAGIDDCAHPSEPGYQHFDWLRVQLQFMRDRGMKAILMGHVPPARTSGKQLWHETCWQKYTLWLRQYRDVVITSLYGHMNIDHFLLQDTKEIDSAYLGAQSDQLANIRETMEDEISIEGSKDYLMELREDWSKLPDPVRPQNFEESKKKKKGGKKKKIGGPWAERYQLTLISPSVVPNYFPTLRVFEYNITSIEDAPTWLDIVRKSGMQSASAPDWETHSLELRSEPDVEIEKKKKKKGKHGKDPNPPNLRIPDAPAKGNLPGPGYYPQPLTLKGYVQYYANLTVINNDITVDNADGDELSSNKWDAGKHHDKKPKHDKPQPKEFNYQVEYTTFDDKIYKLKDLTVRSFLRLAHRIGETSADSTGLSEEYEDGDDEEVIDDEVEDVESADEEEDSDTNLEAEKKKKKKKGGHKMKNTKIWLHFLKHAFVSTKSIDELKDIK
ncbi:Endopolyphosphatase [Annulohypoxylon nitens]|nr:Endopolyphosphatase [Annulohypoxylon nitens]